MPLECVVDARESTDLVPDVAGVGIVSEMLPLGDVVVRDKETKEVLMLIERKSVRDLAQSLRDGRHHDQRRRWLAFREQSPNTIVSLWVEGDLMAAPMDEVMRSSLLNSLFRAQTRHHILVHHARNRDAFARSMRLTLEKLMDDPRHLLTTTSSNDVPLPQLACFRRSARSVETYWQDCLSLIPGVSPPTAAKIAATFPTMAGFVRALADDQNGVVVVLSEVRLSDKRRLGVKLAGRIASHFCQSEEKN